MRRRISNCKLALVTTAGLVEAGQPSFDSSIKGGDFSFREIGNEVDVRTLVDSHRSESFDHTGVHADPNLAFPLDRLREMQHDAVIGELNHRHWSFMGSITAPRRLVAQTAPAAAQQAVDDGVEAVLLVPV